jgi:hypothetical protein
VYSICANAREEMFERAQQQSNPGEHYVKVQVFERQKRKVKGMMYCWLELKLLRISWRNECARLSCLLRFGEAIGRFHRAGTKEQRKRHVTCNIHHKSCIINCMCYQTPNSSIN